MEASFVCRVPLAFSANFVRYADSSYDKRTPGDAQPILARKHASLRSFQSVVRKLCGTHEEQAPCLEPTGVGSSL